MQCDSASALTKLTLKAKKKNVKRREHKVIKYHVYKTIAYILPLCEASLSLSKPTQSKPT